MNPEITSLVDQSVKLETRGEFGECARLAAEALTRARQNDEDREALCLALSQFAWSRMRIGEIEAAKTAAQEVLTLAPDSRPAILALMTISFINLQNLDITSTEQHLQQAITLSRKLHDLSSLARAQQNLVTSVYLVRGQFNLSVVMLEESSILKSEMGQYSWGFPAISALIYLAIGNRVKARQTIQELGKIIDPGARSAATYYYLVASLALDEEQFDTALENLQRAYRIAVRSGAPEINIWVRCEYSRYHRLQDEPGAALAWANDAIQVAETSLFHHMHVQALIEKAQVLYQLDDAEAALASLEAAGQLAAKMDCQYEQARIHLLKAIYLFPRDEQAARSNWLTAYQKIKHGEYWFLIEKKRKAVFPLLKIFLDSQDVALRESAEDLFRRLANISPVPLRIYGLGQFRVFQGNRLVADTSLKKRKAGELLMFLLMQPTQRASKEVVVDQLWRDAQPESGIQLLHQATSTLRRILEPDIPDRFPSHYIWFEGDQVCLRLPPGSVVDFLEFSASLQKAIESENPLFLERTLGLYDGPLFPQSRYDDWVTTDRNRLIELFLNGAETLGRLYLESKEYRSALDLSLRMLQIDPFCEPAALIAMSAYIQLQDAPRAIRVFREIERQLAEELNLLPRNDLRELADSLRHPQ